MGAIIGGKGIEGLNGTIDEVAIYNKVLREMKSNAIVKWENREGRSNSGQATV